MFGLEYTEKQFDRKILEIVSKAKIIWQENPNAYLLLYQPPESLEYIMLDVNPTEEIRKLPKDSLIFDCIPHSKNEMNLFYHIKEKSSFYPVLNVEMELVLTIILFLFPFLTMEEK